MMWQPLLPVWLIAVAGAGACAVALWWTWRSRALTPAARLWLVGWRAAVVAALVVMLLGPRQMNEASREPRNVEVAIAVDTSASMTRTDLEPTRYAHGLATWLTDANTRHLAEASTVTAYGFAGDIAVQSIPQLRATAPTGSESHIIRAVRQLVASGPAQRRAVVVISDGHDTRFTEDAQAVDRVMGLAVAMGIRVFVAPVGTEATEADLAVRVIARPDELFDEQPVRIEATVQRRHTDTRQTTATLWVDGVATQTIRAAFAEDQASRRIVFDHTPQVLPDRPQRTIDYAVRIDRLSGETDTANNEDHGLVRMVGRRIAVLLLEGEPHWDTRFFSAALADDPQVVLTTLHAVTADRVMMSRPGDDGSTDDVTVTLPLRDAVLNRFDVLALGRGMRWFFPGEQAGAIERFAGEHGGGVVFVRGMPYERDAMEAKRILAPLLDVANGWRRPIRQASPDGSKIARAMRIRHGNGRSVVIDDDELWRWSMRAGEDHAWPAAYRRFMGEVVRWAAVGDGFVPSEAVSILPERLSDATGVPRTVVVRVRDASGADDLVLRVTGPDGHTRDVALASDGGMLERTGVFTPNTPGVYELAVGEARAKLIATSSDREMRETAARPDLLAKLAEGTGGAVLRDGDIGPVVAALRGAAGEDTGREPGAWAWAQWWLLGGMAAALTVEWFSRRRLGLA